MDAEKKALSAYRGDSAKRHKILGGMLPYWKEIRGLLSRMSDSVSQALESASRIDGFVEDYEKIRQESEESTRALTYSAIKFFLVSLLVLGVALGGQGGDLLRHKVAQRPLQLALLFAQVEVGLGHDSVLSLTFLSPSREDGNALLQIGAHCLHLVG